ncbi:MAG: calcium-binding protein [Hyphomicrobiaceae bacterium]
MPTDDYELARQIIEAALQSEFVLPAYTGSTTDLAYLKQWVLAQVTAIYGVDATLFDTSTVVSTSVLRDFVHRALYQTTTPNDYADVVASPSFLGFDDVARSFRYPMWGLCSEMAWQEWQVFRAFGYQTNTIATINGDLSDWTDSHSMTQVYVSDLGKYIIQDSTFNFIYRDASGSILSFDEARAANLAGALSFDGFADYRYYLNFGYPAPEISASLQDYFRQNYLETTFWWYDANGNQTSLVTALFRDSAGAHDPATYQGGVFASQVDAVAAVAAQHALVSNWADIAAALRDSGYYVSGFATADSSGNRIAEYLTVRLSSGAYLSIDIATNATLSGSFDQISAEAFGGTVANPGEDLSAFTGPVYLLSASGAILNSGVAPVVPNDILGTAGSDNLLGTSASDRIIGGDGNDVLSGLEGPNYLSGGRGDDTYYVNAIGDRIMEFANEGYDIVYTNVTLVLDATSEVEFIATYGSATTQAINLTGSNIANTLVGNSAANIIDGRGGADLMWGYGGNDTYFVDNAGDRVVELAGQGIDTIIASVSYTLDPSSEVERLQTASSSSTDVINFYGNGFANILGGNAASNILDGGGGADVMWGFAGDDNYYVDTAGDVVVEAPGGGLDTIYASCDYRLPDNVEILNLKNAAIQGAGNSGEYWIYGNANANILDARTGTGHLYGDLGNDTYYVDSLSDTVYEAPGEGIDTIYASLDYTLPENVEILNLTGTALRGAGNAGTY